MITGRGSYYRYCGMTIRSDLVLPELPASTSVQEAQVVIEEAAVPSSLPDATRRTTTFQVDGRQVLWNLKDIARYRITRCGRLIEVDSAPRADPLAVRLFLLHPVFALAALLRGEYLLNAAAVAVGGAVTAFVGVSSSGKSTAAGVLATQGYPVVSDSLLRLTTTAQGEVLAHPQAPWLLLWPDSVGQIGLSVPSHRLRAELEIRRWKVPCADRPLPLARIAALHQQRSHDLDLFEPEAHSGLDSFEVLGRSTAGHEWLEDLPVCRPGHFLWATRIARTVPIGQLTIPWGWDRLANYIEELSRWCRRD